MAIQEYGEGFGRDYEAALPVVDGQEGRREKVVTQIIGGKKVTITIRESIAPTDPVVLLTKASLYTQVLKNAKFPMPPIRREIKEALIRTAE